VVNIVVLKADDRQFGLVVESVSDTEEIVVKPLGKQLNIRIPSAQVLHRVVLDCERMPAVVSLVAAGT
jgi:CheW-like domain